MVTHHAEWGATGSSRCEGLNASESALPRRLGSVWKY
jgi:hypothetical protein